MHSLGLVSLVSIMIIGPVGATLSAHGQEGARGSVRRPPAAGWSTERAVSRAYDDWEPAIAADPNAPYLYRLVTRYGQPACANKCPDAAIVLQASGDNGGHWGPGRYLCRCVGSPWQADPQIEVAANSGIVEAAFLNQYNVWFTSSSDHGKTWTKAASVIGTTRWADKPILTTNPSGKNVYIAFNGPSDGNALVAVSHDYGVTWHQHTAVDTTRYTYAFGGHVLPGGDVVFSESLLQYAADGKRLMGVDQVVAIRSTDGGRTWTKKVVDVLQLGKICTSTGCKPDFYDGHTALGVDGSGRLILLADGALKRGGVRRVYAYLSLDHGATWTTRVRLSLNSSDAGFPAAVGTSGGEFRIWFADHRTGRWNILYRTSTDGRHWTPGVRLSNVVGGRSYKSPAGFEEFYGDYGEIDVTNTGKTVAIWGEGPSYNGPGGSWFARQT